MDKFGKYIVFLYINIFRFNISSYSIESRSQIKYFYDKNLSIFNLNKILNKKIKNHLNLKKISIKLFLILRLYNNLS